MRAFHISKTDPSRSCVANSGLKEKMFWKEAGTNGGRAR